MHSINEKSGAYNLMKCIGILFFSGETAQLVPQQKSTQKKNYKESSFTCCQ